MPQRPDKWKALFADLGRPTKRGIRKCPKCGTVNGTRGNSCKNKSCDVIFRDNGAAKKATTEACRVSINIPGLQIFSARLRDRGPDYRNFVQLPESQSLATPETQSDAKCYVDACIKNKEFPCSHIQAAQRCFSESRPLNIKHSTISSLNIPSEQQQTLSVYINETTDILVQRVSKTSFVVQCAVSAKHPLGYLHIMFFKNKKEDGNAKKKFLCTCKPYKVQNRDSESAQSNSGEGIEFHAKFCVHYHACLCAFASDDSLSAEFDYFLSQANQNCAPTLLSQLHLVTLPQPGNTTTVDGIDASHISVEIMQENISLLESIAAADDATLQNVQGLEGVLSDQIIVTNVDDSLSFGETTGLEGLDDSDSQVCQIFASAQNAIQLANAFTNSENVHQTVNITTSTMLTPTSGGKRRRQGSGDGTIDVLTHSTQPLSVTNHYEHKSSMPKCTITKGFQGTTFTYTTTTTPAVSPIPQMTPTHPPEPPPANLLSEGFEMWLSGVNERLNAAMNYQFSGKPDPVVYYISTEYFECLKDRITSGVKKKRLPNQTVIVPRTDRPPTGIFTKHVWKITNIIHVLQIFHNQIIPLKISQYFSKGTNGIYEERIPPNEMDRKNQLIKPHLHSTYLKVGKNDPNAVESVPFIIEWIPDILPQSKLGELSLIFEFGRTTPVDESSNTKEMSY